jgi:hypothetical protein
MLIHLAELEFVTKEFFDGHALGFVPKKSVPKSPQPGCHTVRYSGAAEEDFCPAGFLFSVAETSVWLGC